MDPQKRTLLITGVVIIVILAAIIAVIISLVRFFKSGVSNQGNIFPKATVSPAPAGTPTGSPISQTNTLIYAGQGYQFQYPRGWGVLTCSNSQNIELDPNTPTDSRGITCDFAIKPITVLVSDSLSCQGDSINIGNIAVVKSKTGTSPEIVYRWCTKTTPALDITHRVSSTGSRATSTTDYSAQIEEIIKSLTFARGS